MKRCLFFVAVLWACLAQAQNTYRWVDDKGKVHFGDRPPVTAAGKVVEERRQARGAGSGEQVSSEARQAAEKFPVMLYVSADCGEPCKQGSAHLKKLGIPFTEKMVSSAEETDALAKAAGGAPVVPLLQVGSKVRKGFAAVSWDDLLDISGYPTNAGTP
jgi:hypothetical protein